MVALAQAVRTPQTHEGIPVTADTSRLLYGGVGV